MKVIIENNVKKVKAIKNQSYILFDFIELLRILKVPYNSVYGFGKIPIIEVEYDYKLFKEKISEFKKHNLL